MQMQNKYKILKLDEKNLEDNIQSGIKRIYAMQIANDWIKCKISPNGPTWLINFNDVIENLDFAENEWRNNWPEINSVLVDSFNNRSCTMEQLSQDKLSSKIISLITSIVETGMLLNDPSFDNGFDSSPRRDVERTLAYIVSNNGTMRNVADCNVVKLDYKGHTILVETNDTKDMVSLMCGPIMAYGVRIPDENPPNTDDPMSPIM